MDKPRIGFIGIGIMGTPMAGNLAKAVYSLTIYDVDRSRTEALASEHRGIVIAKTPRAAGESSDIVITMLPSGTYVREVALGNTGVIAGLHLSNILPGVRFAHPWPFSFGPPGLDSFRNQFRDRN